MAILYACDDCGKEFNLQIKLKKHMQSAHVNQKDLKPNDYLDEGIEFTDDEKAYYFDDLQTKYAELKSKVEFFEKRYELIKPGGTSDPSHNLSSKVKRQKRDFDEYTKDSSSDPYLPEGWRSGSMKNSVGSKNVRSERLNGFPGLSSNARKVLFLASYSSRTVLT